MLPALPKNRTFDVIGVGRNSWDRIALIQTPPRLDEKIEALAMESQAGGQVATALVTLSRLGQRVRYLGKFGDDAAGRAIRSALVREGVELSESSVLPGVSNQTSLIFVDQKTHSRTIVSYTDPRLGIAADDFPLEKVLDARILLLGGRHPNTMIPYARAAQGDGALVAINADDASEGAAELLRLSHIVVGPMATLKTLAGVSVETKTLEEIASWGPSIVVGTRGREGSIASLDGEIFEQSCVPVAVKDTTGAGDVFQGALLAGICEGISGQELLHYASSAAALKCRALGGQKGIPGKAELGAFLKTTAH